MSLWLSWKFCFCFSCDGAWARKCELWASWPTQSLWLLLLIRPQTSAWPDDFSGLFQIRLKSTSPALHLPAPSPASEVTKNLRPVAAVPNMLIYILREAYLHRPQAAVKNNDSRLLINISVVKQENVASVFPRLLCLNSRLNSSKPSIDPGWDVFGRLRVAMSQRAPLHLENKKT